MTERVTILFNWLALVMMLSVNTIAATATINGFSTKDVSDRYPNFFVPAGFTFSIWSVIYILLIGFVVHSTRVLLKKRAIVPTKAVREISPLFQLSCLLNVSWIFAWQYLQINLSVIIMISFLALLIYIYQKLQFYHKQLDNKNYIWIYLPFAVYLGWISVATIANVTALLVNTGWDGFGLSEIYWSYIMVIVATLLGLIFSWFRKEWAFTLVIIWALFGIYSAQKQKPEIDHTVPLISLSILFLSVLVSWFRKSRAAGN